MEAGRQTRIRYPTVTRVPVGYNPYDTLSPVSGILDDISFLTVRGTLTPRGS